MFSQDFPRFGRRYCRRDRGMTILELAVVIVIIFIVASMLFPAFSSFQARTSEARCTTNLKNLFVGASGYVQTNASWPQIPNTLIGKDDKTYAKLWVAVLKPYGVPHESWICPTIQRNLGLPMSSVTQDENYRVDYIGIAFDDKPSSPYPENAFPWFVEKAGFHGRGNLLILSNGTTTSLMDLSR